MENRNPKKMYNCVMWVSVVDVTVIADDAKEASEIILHYINKTFKDSYKLKLDVDVVMDNLTEVTYMDSFILSDNSRMDRI